jgi:hypothetical protein
MAANVVMNNIKNNINNINKKLNILIICSDINNEKSDIRKKHVQITLNTILPGMVSNPDTSPNPNMLSNHNITQLTGRKGNDTFPDGLTDYKDDTYDFILFVGCNNIAWIFKPATSINVIKQLNDKLKKNGRIVFIENENFIKARAEPYTIEQKSTIKIENLQEIPDNKFTANLYMQWSNVFSENIVNGCITYMKKIYGGFKKHKTKKYRTKKYRTKKN